jgi:prepilin-type N-terminal cleavage/methylation domain-containing protein
MTSVNHKGFTLIEVLVAIAILSFISLGVFQILDDTISTQDSVTKEDKEFIYIQTGLRRLETDFERIFSPLFFDFPKITSKKEQESFSYSPESQSPYNNHDNFDGVTNSGIPIPAIFFEKNKEIILFTRTNTRKYKNSKVTSFNWVRYRVESSIEREGLERLTRQAVNADIYNNNIPWDKTPVYTIIDGLKKIEFFLWDPQKNEWSDSVPDQGKYLGSMLKVKLLWVGQKEDPHTVQKVFRIFYPEFDTVKDQELKTKAMYPSLSKTQKKQERL